MSPADVSAGIFAAIGAMIALIERERSGKGQWVQANLLSSQIMLLDYQAMSWLMDGHIPQQRANDHPKIVPTGVYKAKDGYFTISTVGNDSYHRLCSAIGAPELSSDPRFVTADLRESNRDALNASIEAATSQNTASAWIECLNAAGVPAGPIYKLDEMFSDPQVKEIGIVQSLNHPKLGHVEILGQPIKLSRTPAEIRRAPPELGEHTDEVLAEFGFEPAEVAKLRRLRVI